MTSASHTPILSDSELQSYLENDLANELHWMLRAAIEWHIQDVLNLSISGYHMQVLAMDSTFLHARTLFEFFTTRTTGNHYGYNAYRINLASGHPPQVPTVYLTEHWNSALHAYLIHAQDRTVPRTLRSFDPSEMKDLKNMPVDFAQEAVRLWREFATKLGSSAETNIQKLEATALSKLNEAVQQTEDVYTRKKVTVMKRKFPISHISW